MIADQVNFCPRCGAAMERQERFGKLRSTCPACEWIYFPDPKVAVAVLVCDQEKILLVRRTNEPMRGYWTLPAGFVDAGEDPARAAERECLEETGLSVTTAQLLDVIAGQAHPRGAHILIVYQADKRSGSLKPGDDADQARFFELENLPPLAFSSTQSILNAWREKIKTNHLN